MLCKCGFQYKEPGMLTDYKLVYSKNNFVSYFHVSLYYLLYKSL